jgi:hypothetical protein
MKIHTLICLLSCSAFLFIVSCNSGQKSEDANLAPNAHKVVAEQVINGNSYTYIQVSSEGGSYWIAISRSDVKEGGTYYWSVGSEMKEFTSKELNRTFRSIYFVEDLTDKPITRVSGSQQMPAGSMAGRQVAPEYPGIVVPKIEGVTTIADLYSKKGSLGGKTVRVCGKVVKFAGDIMNRNWVHIQDGTKSGSDYDLALTTQDSVKVGDIVIFEGILAVNKNIGAGYHYNLLLENAVLKK